MEVSPGSILHAPLSKNVWLLLQQICIVSFAILDTYVVLFCTEIGELQMVIAGASTGKIWIQEALFLLRTYPHSPESSRAEEMVNLFDNLAQGSKLGCFLHRAGATIISKGVH